MRPQQVARPFDVDSRICRLCPAEAQDLATAPEAAKKGYRTPILIEITH